MKFDITDMRAKVLLIFDEDSDYTQEDFNEEFGSGITQSTHNDDYKIKLSFVNESNNEDPQYATVGSSGFDLRANLKTPMTIEGGKFKIIPTGLFFSIPEGFEIQVRPRSGLAAKNGVTVLNTPGTIDADYRGEIMVILINHSDIDFVVNHGDRIAQAVLSTVTAKNVVKLIRVDDISKDTERGSGGFGSTGIK